MSAPDAPVAPRLRSIAARLAWVSALGGVLLALVLALLGVGAAKGDGELFASLLPAVLAIGLGMAVPPFLLAVAAIALAGLRRSRRADMIAAAIGAVVGAFISPVVFYPASATLGLSVALVIAVAAGCGYPLLVRGLWRRAS
ncbi:hypothetical protein H4J02_05780 [Protaetiibacter sp. SSC-01]|uniref:hypothetical protein n=1 Tax=Protaetiibacter sp. SSC-01 TaxID=2759943 RepID=UPI001656A953|nr:hypothetical protein [Protaetiibacter sp. SSC-01]QNO38510.1 hypothetical protein H4J02_05780 [Protaetiibacter sp. SSC-01]